MVCSGEVWEVESMGGLGGGGRGRREGGEEGEGGEWKGGMEGRLKWKGGKGEGLGMAVELSNPLRHKSIVKIDQ